MAKKTWAVVANRGGAYFFEIENSKNLRLFDTMINAKGRLKNQELNADRPGRVKDRVGKAKHSMMRPNSPKEQICIEFAKKISRTIEKARSHSDFEQLYLVAPTKLLSEIKFDLKPTTQRLIQRSFRKALREDNMERNLGRLLFGPEYVLKSRKTLPNALCRP